MAIELPRVLKNMNFFVNGRGYAGRVDEIQLPKLTLKTEEHRAGGMDIPVEIELGMEKLEAQLTISDYDPEVFKLFGLLRGGWKELESSNWKPGDKGTLTVMVATRYYKLSIDGQELVEIDAVNLVRKVGGTDQMDAIRAAIGA